MILMSSPNGRCCIECHQRVTDWIGFAFVEAGGICERCAAKVQRYVDAMRRRRDARRVAGALGPEVREPMTAGDE
jgi:recombinational DNA repair protein (RecF pathway)